MPFFVYKSINKISHLIFAAAKTSILVHYFVFYGSSKGKVAQIIGPVVDVSFDTAVAPLPNIYDSLEISKDDGSQLVWKCSRTLVRTKLEPFQWTQQMDCNGADVVATGNPIQMPIGEAVNGRLFNVIGDAIDGISNLQNHCGLPIHREAPQFDQLSTSTEFFTGIKVIDLIEPYAKVEK